MTALNKIGQRDIVTGSPERGLAAGFSRHDSGVQWCEKKMAPDDLGHQGPDAPLAHRRPEYPSSGCVPAEPDSVSPGTCSLPYWHDSRQKAPQSGVQKIPQPKIRREALDARGSFREGLWEPRAGNRPGPPGRLCARLCAPLASRSEPPQSGQQSSVYGSKWLTAPGGNGDRRCCSCPGCPPRFRFLRSLRGGLGGLTISLDGGLEEVEEFLRAAANCCCKRATSSCSRAFSSSNCELRSITPKCFSSSLATRWASR